MFTGEVIFIIYLCFVCLFVWFIIKKKKNMARVIVMGRHRMHQTIVTILIVILLNGFDDVLSSAALNQNQVIENLKFLSQIDGSSSTNSNLQPPSRLRALLVNDLRNILVKNVCAIFCCVCRDLWFIVNLHSLSTILFNFLYNFLLHDLYSS